MRLAQRRPRRRIGAAALLMLAAAMLLAPTPATAQDAGAFGAIGGATDDGDSVVSFDTAWSATAGQVGEPITLAIVLDIDEGYGVTSHLEEPPQIPLSVQITDAAAELGLSSPVFPEPHDKQVGPDHLSVFEGRTVIYVPMQVNDGQPGDTLSVTVAVEWQACDDQICLLPETTEIDAELPLAAAADVEPANAELFEGFDAAAAGGGGGIVLNIPLFGWDFDIDPTQLWLLLLIAAVGGFLLNLTPCVLPLIPIKIMGLSQAAGTRSRTFALGLVMVTGVLAFWLTLGLIISLASGFTAMNQLFQYPAFTIGVGVVIAAMAVGMCGLFTVQLPQWVYRLNPSQQSPHGSFGFGIMIAVLSTPCTAPFMGAAAAWATTQSPAVTLSTFAAIGIGMAMPYLVLAGFPQLTHRMPKAGPASELIKQVMGLLLLGAAAYFLGTGLSGLMATPPDPPSQAYWWAVGLCIAAAGLWLGWRTLRLTDRVKPRGSFVTLGLVLALSGAVVGQRFSADSPIDWIYYTPERFEAAQQRGDIIVLEFTAEWCLNCKALEQAVLHQREVVQRLNSDGVAPIKVDLTGNNPIGNEKLAEVGRRTIPLLIVYDRGGEETLRSDAYTVRQVLDALEPSE